MTALQRRRQTEGLCLHCGYDLRGGAEGACPECGRTQPRVGPAAGARLHAGRLFLVLWAALVALWMIAAIGGAKRWTLPDRAAQLAQMAQEAVRAAPDLRGRPLWQHPYTAKTDYGWPWVFASVIVGETCICDLGGEPRVMVDSPLRTPGWVASEGFIHWTPATDDRTAWRHVDACWTVGLVQAAGLQLAALGLLAVLAVAARLRQARASREYSGDGRSAQRTLRDG